MDNSKTKSEKLRPVMLHTDTVALVHIYERPCNTDFSDMGYGYFWEATGNEPVAFEDMAKNFMEQIEDHMCIAFMDALSKELKQRVDAHEKMVKEMNNENQS